MRDYILYINKVRAKLLLMLVAVVLVACSDDSDDTIGVETDVLQLIPYSQEMAEASSLSTRAVTLPTGYSPYDGPNSIGVYATTASEAPDKVRTFSYVNGAWNSQVSVTNGITYYLYGYMPVNENIMCTISKRSDIDNADYSNGAVLSFTNLPPVLAGDFSVVTGIRQVSSASPEEAVSLTAGNFSYEGRAAGSNFVCLMLDHLYSCVRFRFLVDDDYSKLRTIKLKEVKLKTQSNVTYPLTVTLRAGQDCDISYGAQASLSSDFATLFTSTTQDGDALSSLDDEAKVVEGYFAPFADVANYLLLECKYNVYGKDKNGDLVLTRKNCVATNKLPANRIMVGLNQRTTITLTVNPTYLYVLSEPDLDNPTITIN